MVSSAVLKGLIIKMQIWHHCFNQKRGLRLELRMTSFMQKREKKNWCNLITYSWPKAFLVSATCSFSQSSEVLKHYREKCLLLRILLSNWVRIWIWGCPLLWICRFHFEYYPNCAHSQKSIFQQRHIQKKSTFHIRCIPKKAYSKTGTFKKGHIQKKTHSKESIFQKGHIPKRAHSKKGTFRNGNIPKWAHSKKGTFQKGHIPKRANSVLITNKPPGPGVN